MSIGVAKWVFQQFPITVQELSAASRLEIKREELLLGMKMPEGSSRSQRESVKGGISPRPEMIIIIIITVIHGKESLSV